MQNRLLPAALMIAACAPTLENNGIRVYVKYWEPVEREISLRARVDLQCSAVDVLLLNRQGKLPVNVAAEGCGRTAIYQRLLRRKGPFFHHTTTNTVWELVSASPATTPQVAVNPYAIDD